MRLQQSLCCICRICTGSSQGSPELLSAPRHWFLFPLIKYFPLLSRFYVGKAGEAVSLVARVCPGAWVSIPEHFCCLQPPRELAQSSSCWVGVLKEVLNLFRFYCKRNRNRPCFSFIKQGQQQECFVQNAPACPHLPAGVSCHWGYSSCGNLVALGQQQTWHSPLGTQKGSSASGGGLVIPLPAESPLSSTGVLGGSLRLRKAFACCPWGGAEM